MKDSFHSPGHNAEHVGAGRRALFQPAASDLIRVGSRRWFLQTGLAGLAGLSLPNLLRSRAKAAAAGDAPRKTAVILFWLSGGPSQFETWDPKPDAPSEIRGPWQSIPTKLPEVRIGEHLPLQASIIEKLTLIRSIDCRTSDDHHPATMQSGNPLAKSPNKPGPNAGVYPSMASVAARFRGPNDPEMPACVGVADPGLYHADIWGAGHLGAAYEPARHYELAGRLTLAQGVNVARAQDRVSLSRQLNRLQRDLDSGKTMAQMDHFGQQALTMILSGKARQAFQLDLEPPRVRDAYGRDSFGEKALLARRLVEAGVTYVVVSGIFGYFDNHGDHVVWGGLNKGLKPLLPSVDRSLFALVNDLEARGLLDTTLVLMLGEFGRTPIVGPEGGRDHYPVCSSMLLAGGGFPHGQVIGSTDSKGGDIKDGRVTPSDLGATVYRHLGIDLSAHWTDPQGRPQPIVTEGGRPIPGLS